MKYGYVCTNYNGAKLTAGAINSLMSGKLPPAKIVVVDNVSRPEERVLLQELARNYHTVEIIFNGDNVGYFPGLNIGIRKIRQIHPDFDCIIVGNNDLEFPEDFGQMLSRAVTRLGRYPVLSPDIITADGVHQNPHVIRPVGRFRELMYDVYHSNYYASLVVKYLAVATQRATDRLDETMHDVPQFIHQGHGSVYILTRTFFEHFEEVWAPTFLLGEEYFLSKQLARKGLAVYYDPSVKVRHLWHATMNSVPSFKVWTLSRAAHKVYRQCVSPWRRGTPWVPPTDVSLPGHNKQSWPGKFGQWDKWSFCLKAARMPHNRRDHDKTNAPEPLTGIQGEGGPCGSEGREDAV